MGEMIGGEQKVEGDVGCEMELKIKGLMDIGWQGGVGEGLGVGVRGERRKKNGGRGKGRKKRVGNKKKGSK